MLIGAPGLAHLTPLFFELETVIPLTVTTPATVEPRSDGPATNGIPPTTDANSWSLYVNFFYFFIGNNRSLPITEENC